MQKPEKSQKLDLAIESLAFGGRGVARQNGFVIFVEGAFPGDRVQAVITRAKRSYAEARAIKVLYASADRMEPACRHFGICGGCSWQSLSYEKQLEFKQRQVHECLKHIGGLHEEFTPEQSLGAEPLWRYRNKVEFSFAVSSSGGIDLGFHLPGQWRQVLNIEDCLLHSELTNRIRNRVRELARDTGVAAYDQHSGSGFWRHLVIREGVHTGEVLVNLVTSTGEFPCLEDFVRALTTAFPEIASLIWSINSTKASVATGFPFQVLAGKDHYFEEINGLRLKVAPSSFLQTNTLMAERLYQKTLEFAGLNGNEFVLDLYSGIGSIGLMLAGSCDKVFGVELCADASGLAAENARANGFMNARFSAGKVRRVLKEPPFDGKPDLVVLDPPRAGASRKEIERIIELGAARIVYVSCNASTLAGNAAQLAEAGYLPNRFGAVDMFPHTPHIEVVAQFKLS